jgi:DNA-binding winged helix-turn-helix (wHTH) protein
LRYRFDGYVLDADRRELRRGDTVLTVEPLVFDILAYLIRNRERVVSKEDLRAAVWAGRIVSYSTLSSCITSVRAAIGDNGEDQRLVRTLPRRGCRFVGPVLEEPEVIGPTEGMVSASHQPASGTASAATSKPAIGRPRMPLILGVGAGAATVAAAFLFFVPAMDSASGYFKTDRPGSDYSNTAMDSASGYFKQNTDRPGSDYSNTAMGSASGCSLACSQQNQCRAWTFVKPGVQTASGRCWLKNSVPQVYSNNCCTSGIK